MIKKCRQLVPAFHMVDIDHSVVSEHSLYIYLRQYFEHRSVFKKIVKIRFSGHLYKSRGGCLQESNHRSSPLKMDLNTSATFWHGIIAYIL